MNEKIDNAYFARDKISEGTEYDPLPYTSEQEEKRQALISLGELFGNKISAEELHARLTKESLPDSNILDSLISIREGLIRKITKENGEDSVLLEPFPNLEPEEIQEELQDIAQRLSGQENPPIKSTILDGLQTLID